MDQDDLLKEFEFREGKVRCPDRRPALLAHNTEPDMGLLQARDQYLGGKEIERQDKVFIGSKFMTLKIA